MDDKFIYDIWLILCKIDNIDKINLIDRYGDAYSIWQNIINEGIPLKYSYLQKMKEAWDKDKINKFLEYLSNKNIKFVLYNKKDYPKELINIPDPPYVLFYKGDISILNDKNGIAVIGSRNCTSYGVEAAKFIVRDLVRNSINVVSGGARGIDSVAHRSCLQNKGITTVVLGCGIDRCYPNENKRLFEEVERNGVVISEFLPGTPPMAHHFPMRNRIISGLSKGIIVVEAAENSGTNTTVGCAAQQSRDVFAVPGSIFSNLSKGCTKIIADGGFPFISVEDMLERLGINTKENIQISTKNPLKNLILGLIQDTPVHIEEIAKVTNIDIKVLYGLLFEMQLEEIVLCLSGNFYVRAN